MARPAPSDVDMLTRCAPGSTMPSFSTFQRGDRVRVIASNTKNNKVPPPLHQECVVERLRTIETGECMVEVSWTDAQKRHAACMHKSELLILAKAPQTAWTRKEND